MSARPPIVQERLLPAPPAIVFECWRDPESMAVWMCPGSTRRSTVEIDFRVGGRYRIVMHADDDFAHHGEYLAIEPVRRIAFTWVSEFMPPEIAATRVDVTLEPVGDDRTLLTLVHEAIPDHDAYDGHPDGWASIVEKLDAHLGRRTP